MIRLLLVGLGRQGTRHLRVAGRTAGLAVAATVDPHAPGTGEVPHFDKLDDALDAGSYDAAVVATPTPEHAAAVRSLVEARIPMLVEKPMAIDVPEAEELAVMAASAGVLLAVGFVERFNPAVSVVSAMLRRGSLGRPICMNFRRLGLPPAQSPGVDVIHDLAVHDIDVFKLLAGRGVILAGVNGWPAGGPSEAAHLLLQAGSVNGSVHANWKTPVRVRDFSVTTDTCYVEANYTTQQVEVVEPHEPAELVEYGDFQSHYGTARRVQLDLLRAEPLARELEAFADAVRGEISPLLALADDGVAAVAIADAATARLRHG